ncbi:MAG TPA: hypothetical protein VGV37_13325 [Aliidongia sp.]|uniref:hypothetical protein n=1 Tax=Aliidongia sp. TaxID=1914230 RepID=UPI002DDD2B61|nr:hypothetical protein [Aliidongia sp.]HEV2675519.1 hypothetical protein [Aliidongia sp.]
MKKPDGLTLSQWVKTLRAQILYEMTLNPDDWLILNQTEALALTSALVEIAQDIRTLEAQASVAPPLDPHTNVVPFSPVRRLTSARPNGGGDVA